VLSGRDLCDGLITRPEESYGCVSVVSVVCCQVEVSAMGWSLVQRSPMDVCLLWVFCVVRERSLRRADHSPRGVLLTVVRRCVWSRNLVNEEALAQWGLSRQNQTVLFATQLCDSVQNISHLTSPPISPTRHRLLRVQSWVSNYTYFYHPMNELLVGWWDNVHSLPKVPLPVMNLTSISIILRCVIPAVFVQITRI